MGVGTTIGSASIAITGDMSQLVGTLNRTEGHVKGFSANLKEAASAFRGFGIAALAVRGVETALRGVQVYGAWNGFVKALGGSTMEALEAQMQYNKSMDEMLKSVPLIGGLFSEMFQAIEGTDTLAGTVAYFKAMEASLAASAQYARQLGQGINMRQYVASGASPGTVLGVRHGQERDDVDQRIAEAKKKRDEAKAAFDKFEGEFHATGTQEALTAWAMTRRKHQENIRDTSAAVPALEAEKERLRNVQTRERTKQDLDDANKARKEREAADEKTATGRRQISAKTGQPGSDLDKALSDFRGEIRDLDLLNQTSQAGMAAEISKYEKEGEARIRAMFKGKEGEATVEQDRKAYDLSRSLGRQAAADRIDAMPRGASQDVARILDEYNQKVDETMNKLWEAQASGTLSPETSAAIDAALAAAEQKRNASIAAIEKPGAAPEEPGRRIGFVGVEELWKKIAGGDPDTGKKSLEHQKAMREHLAKVADHTAAMATSLRNGVPAVAGG